MSGTVIDTRSAASSDVGNASSTSGTEVQEDSSIGGGILGGTIVVPDDLSTASGSVNMLELLHSLYAMAGARNGQVSEDTQFAMMTALQELSELFNTLQENKINLDQEKIVSLLNAKQKTIEEAARQLEEAAAAEPNHDIWYGIKCGFSIAGALATLTMGAFLLATPGGQLMGGFMLATGGIQLLMAIDTAVAGGTGSGIFLHLGKAIFKDDATAQKFGMIAQCIMIGVAFGVAVFAALRGDASAVAQAVYMVRNGMTIASSIVEMGTAGGDIYMATRSVKVAGLERDARKIQAKTVVLDAQIQSLNDVTESATTHWIDNLTICNELLRQALKIINENTKLAKHWRI